MKTYVKQRLTLSEWANFKSQNAGFTLLELTIILVIVGIVAAIAAPGWNTFMTKQRLNRAQDALYLAMLNAQGTARRVHVPYQAGFRTLNGNVQWAVYPSSANAVAAIWNDLDSNVQLDLETTLQSSGSVYRVQFDERGNIRGQLGRVTLSHKVDERTKRCVIVSTLLGVIRKGEDHTVKQDGKSCY